MHSLGHAFVPPPFHAGGLRYHGMAPTVSQLAVEGIITPRSVQQIQAMMQALPLPGLKELFPRLKPLMPWLVYWKKPRKPKLEGKEKVILVNWSGHGLLDFGAYEKYFSGDLINLRNDR